MFNTKQPNTKQLNTKQPNTKQPNTKQPNTKQPNTKQPNTAILLIFFKVFITDNRGYAYKILRNLLGLGLAQRSRKEFPFLISKIF